MRISDWSSYVCSSDLRQPQFKQIRLPGAGKLGGNVLPDGGYSYAVLFEQEQIQQLRHIGFVRETRNQAIGEGVEIDHGRAPVDIPDAAQADDGVGFL